MVNMLVSSAVDRGFEPRLGQTKDYKISICCFSAKHAALRRRSKGWLAQNQDNVFEWIDMSIHGLLFQWASPIKNQTKHVGLVNFIVLVMILLKNLWVGVQQQSLTHYYVFGFSMTTSYTCWNNYIQCLSFII